MTTQERAREQAAHRVVNVIGDTFRAHGHFKPAMEKMTPDQLQATRMLLTEVVGRVLADYEIEWRRANGE